MVYLPLWKIWVRQLGWLFPIYGKIIQMFQTTNQVIYVDDVLSYKSPSGSVHHDVWLTYFRGTIRVSLKYPGFDIQSSWWCASSSPYLETTGWHRLLSGFSKKSCVKRLDVFPLHQFKACSSRITRCPKGQCYPFWWMTHPSKPGRTGRIHRESMGAIFQT